MTVLNTIVAKQLKDFKEEVDLLIEKKELKKDEAIFNVLREYIKDSKDILFEGNGYSKEWEEEAAKRGLSNNKTTPSAIKAKVAKKTIELYAEMEVMNEKEIRARHEIELEAYSLRIQIEGRVLGDVALNHVIPTAVNYQNTLIRNVMGLKEVFPKEFETIAKEQMDLIRKISEHISGITINTNAMVEERKKANVTKDEEKKAFLYCEKVKPYFDKIRYHCDKLELMIDDELWPLVKYREMLFTR
jgi:glutamine synthetase